MEKETKLQQLAAELENLNEELLAETAERLRLEKALRESEERYALVASIAHDGLWDWDLRTDEISFSPRWLAMLGHPETEENGRPDSWFKLVHPDDRARLKEQITLHLEGKLSHIENKHRLLHRDGTYRWMLCRGLASRDAEGRAYRLAGSQTDITEAMKTEEQLLEDAFKDELTGLPNRSVFLDHLKLAWSFAKRFPEYCFAVLLLDLDRFKIINDSLGHQAGDQLLVAIARKLESCLGPGDTVARIGGDEYAILLDDIKEVGNAIHLAEKLLDELRVPFSLDGREVYTTVSIGISLSSTGYARSEDILRDADVSLYRAKAAGKARFALFDATMHSRALAQLQVETDLRQDIERREGLVLYYQPIVSLKTGRISGFESLIRWQHRDRGLVSPSEFVSVAEETGLIVPMGRWALREACRQLLDWQERFPSDPPLTISVNLSGKQLAYPHLVRDIEDILDDFAPPDDSFRCEITESVIMDNAEFAIEILRQLRSLRIKLYVDDFGTGYSSLSYLQRFPVNTLKIDQSFVRVMLDNPRNLEIVKTIADLAHKLGMDVIVEGIETPAQLDQLRTLACDYGQGYLFSRPISGEEMSALLTSQPQW